MTDDDHTDRRQDVQDIERLISAIDGREDGCFVTGFDISAEEYEATTATIEIEWEPIPSILNESHSMEGAGVLKRIIEECEQRYEEGAKIDAVLDEARNADVIEDAETGIAKLKQKGELYEPKQGYLRTT